MLKRIFLAVSICSTLSFFSCERKEEQSCISDEEWMLANEILHESSSLDAPPIDTLGPILEAAGLTDVQTIQPRIMVDLRYSTTDNFMKTNVYGGLNRAFLQPEVAVRLAKVQDYLDENHPELRLLIYDAVRPLSVQQFMWDILDSIPVYERTKFVSNPKHGSLHNYGCAVDVTLHSDSLGHVLDMGAGYDDSRKIAYPEMETHYLKTGELTKEQHANRLLLRKAMKAGNFWVLPTEWWHFNAFHRAQAQTKFQVIE